MENYNNRCKSIRSGVSCQLSLNHSGRHESHPLHWADLSSKVIEQCHCWFDEYDQIWIRCKKCKEEGRQ